MLLWIFLLLSLAEAGIAAFHLIKMWQVHQDGRAAYREIEETAGKEEKGGFQPDFQALKRINPNCVAYLYNEGICSYPVVKTKDSSYYLTHLFDGTENESGAIFMDTLNNGPEDPNCILYGHNMYDESMFGFLYHYEEPAYQEQHPVFTLFTESQQYTFRVIGAFRTPADSIVYQTLFDQEPSFTAYQRELFRYCQYTDSVERKNNEELNAQHILTLSTCTWDSSPTERFVVLCIR